MQEFLTPTCYFPSTVLFIDDGHDFLLNFVLHLDEGLAYRLFDEPQAALEHIHNKRCELERGSSPSWSGYTQAKQCPLTHQTMNPALAAMHIEIYNRYRFSEISVVVVDGAMPLMDGLAFCSRIENTNIKKILLINVSDEKLAVMARQEGLIDRYIKKTDSNAAEQIRQAIDELQLQYFKIMSGMICRLLALVPPNCLHDKVFSEFFLKFREEHGITEYYLVDTSGSFLLLDEDANISFLIVKNEADIQLYRELAEKRGICGEVLKEINQGEKIPGFWETSAAIQPLNNGLEHFVSASRIVADQIYYYAHLNGNALFDVRQQKILSYHRYLEELDAEMFISSFSTL